VHCRSRAPQELESSARVLPMLRTRDRTTRCLRMHVPAAHTFVIVTGCRRAVRTTTTLALVIHNSNSEEGSDFIFWRSLCEMRECGLSTLE
jgi:hypothetical protein